VRGLALASVRCEHIGNAFIVRAAAAAMPGLSAKESAWLCVVFPSIVYWPSSMGKEKLVLFGLGIGTYGIAVLLALREWMSSLILITIDLEFTALLRPPMAGIWIAAAATCDLPRNNLLNAGRQAGRRARQFSRPGLRSGYRHSGVWADRIIHAAVSADTHVDVVGFGH
jgi:hypothetical protein